MLGPEEGEDERGKRRGDKDGEHDVRERKACARVSPSYGTEKREIRTHTAPPTPLRRNCSDTRAGGCIDDVGEKNAARDERMAIGPHHVGDSHLHE